jgi:hypothetical protein
MERQAALLMEPEACRPAMPFEPADVLDMRAAGVTTGKRLEQFLAASPCLCGP